jgi:hypothetical protein
MNKISKLQTNPLYFWSSTPQMSLFGYPNFGNKLLDGGFRVEQMDSSLLLEKLYKDIPILRKTIKDVVFLDKENGWIDMKFIENEDLIRRVK